MITLLHLPILTVCSFTLVAMWRFWACIDRMGFMREVSRRAPAMLHGDMIAAAGTMTPFLLAALNWSGLTLPGQSEPAPAALTVFLSLGCIGISTFMLRNADGRIAGHWEGSRESALRTLVALRIIDAIEAAYAVDTPQSSQNNSTGQIIEAQVSEVEK